MLRGVNEILGIGCLPHQPSHGFVNVSTPELDRALVIVIPSHILESVYFPLLESLIIWHAPNKLLDDNLVFDAWETPSGVFFLQHVVIVCLHALLHDPTLDIIVLFMHYKRVVGIVL